MLTLRLTREDRDLLARLVELHASRNSLQGTEVTTASVLRGLIRREAVARGLVDAPEQDPREPTRPPRATKKT